MVEHSDRLALIARAGKRLQGAGVNDAATPQPASETSLAAETLESRQIRSGHGAAISTLDQGMGSSPLPGLHDHGATMRSPEAATPVGLNYPELRRWRMITPDNMRSNLAFEFRAIKRKLLASARNEQTQAITNNLVMITSARPSEGKTFTATNLAVALAAERDLHVLLIDADVIHPSLGLMFEPSGGKGLTDLLSGNCKSIGDVMHRCNDLPNLNVVFAGKRDEHSPELIASRQMANICQDISTRYNDRIIIIDTPPVLASSETANLAALMHQIIMVVAAGQTTRSQLQLALENISVCRNISLLVNKAPQWNRIEGDSYYYYGEDRAGSG